MRAKKGQAINFVILGIILVAVIVLLLYLRGQFFFGPTGPKGLEERMQAIRDHVGDCINEKAPDYIKKIGLQGGHLKTPQGTYRLHQGETVSYLCYDIPGKPQCSNRLLTLQDMESELAEAIKQALGTCLNYAKFKRGYDILIGELNVLVDIGNDIVIITVKQPITLKKDNIIVKENTFSENLAYPIGRLYDVSQEIINVEAEFGEFEQLNYMMAYKGHYVIDKKKPYPDKLYVLQTKDNPYIFQFFIQDEPFPAP